MRTHLDAVLGHGQRPFSGSSAQSIDKTELKNSGANGRDARISAGDLLHPRQLQKIYLVGPSGFVRRRGTRSLTNLAGLGPKLVSTLFWQLGRRQAGADRLLLEWQAQA